MERRNRPERIQARQTNALVRRRSQLADYHQGIFAPNPRVRPDGERIATAEREIANLERKLRIEVEA